MTSARTSFVRRLVEFADVLDGAVSASQSVEAGRKPSARALKKLGFDAKAFDDVRFG